MPQREGGGGGGGGGITVKGLGFLEFRVYRGLGFRGSGI